MNVSMNQHVLKGAAWLGVSKTIIQLFNVIIFLYVANLLTPADYALMGIAVLLIGILDMTTEFGLGEAIVQRKDLTPEIINTVFIVTAFIGVCITGLSIMLAGMVQDFFAMPGVAEVIHVLSFVLLLKSLTIVPYKLMERHLEFRNKAMIDMVAKFVSLTAAAVLAYSGFGVWALVYTQIIQAAITFVGTAFCKPFKPSFRIFQIGMIKDMLVFGVRIIALRFSWYMRDQSDKFIGGKFLEKSEFGYYSYGFQLTRIVQDIIYSVMNTISVPLLAKLQADDDKVNHAYLRLVKYCALVTLPVFIGGLVLSREFFDLFLSDHWLPAEPVFKVACFVQILRMMNAPNENLFIALGKPQYSMNMNLLSVIMLIASFVVAVKWKMAGLIMAWVVVLPVVYVLWTYFTLAMRGLRVRQYLAALKPAIYGSLMMVIILMAGQSLLMSDGASMNQYALAWKMVLMIIGGALSYVLSAYLADKTILSLVRTKNQR